MPHAKEISKAWSEMNLEYAKNYIRSTPSAVRHPQYAIRKEYPSKKTLWVELSLWSGL